MFPRPSSTSAKQRSVVWSRMPSDHSISDESSKQDSTEHHDRGRIAALITLRSEVDISPPPPSRGVFRASLRTHRPLTNMYGRRLLCSWGQFVGTYSVPAYPAYAGCRGRERPASAVWRRRYGGAERCIGMPCACLCSCPTQSAPGFGRCDLDFGEDHAGRWRGTVADPDGSRPLRKPEAAICERDSGSSPGAR
jgi:hypothetical protein